MPHDSLTRGQDGMQRLPAGHQRGRGVSHVHEYHERDDERGAASSELAAALHHLRHAEPRALRGMQCHEDGADEISDEDGNAARRGKTDRTASSRARP